MTFKDMNLNKGLWSALDDMHITEPTAIQSKSFSPIMSGKDIVGIAQTGTGKTFAFLLPTLRLWSFSKSPHPQVLILVPTRELVTQIALEIEKLTSYMNVVTVPVYGGANIKSQQEDILRGVDIVVGTPGRVLDLFLSGALKSKKLKRLIIDEVDEMLNLGFRTQLNNIVDFLPEKRQNLMFSATMPEEVEQIVNNYTSYYTKIEAAPSGAPLQNIDQIAYEVPNFNTKANLLELLLNTDATMSKVLVFACTKKMADVLYERMQEKFEDKVGVMHSSKSQNYRFNTVNSFQEGDIRFIIATDIIARGLDVSSVTDVINFDLPEVPESYIHRIGRTGRAERKGRAISFVSEREIPYKEGIEELMSQAIPWQLVPAELDINEELIELEKEVEFIPFNNHKMKEFKPTGDAFHEKIDKNKKVNNKIRHETLMQKKYKKQYRRKRK